MPDPKSDIDKGHDQHQAKRDAEAYGLPDCPRLPATVAGRIQHAYTDRRDQAAQHHERPVKLGKFLTQRHAPAGCQSATHARAPPASAAAQAGLGRRQTVSSVLAQWVAPLGLEQDITCDGRGRRRAGAAMLDNY